MIHKILAITTIRSDYDLLSGIYRMLNANPDVEFRLLVGGAHLSPTYGMTISEIQRDGLPILREIECLLDSNSPSSRVKTGAILLNGMIDAMTVYKPDVVLYAGDREDALMAATACSYLKIPSVHFFGGDHSTDGNVDNPVRHAISKFSTFHFVSHPAHSRRLLRLGEASERIHIIGSPALDKFRAEPHLDKAEVLATLGAAHIENYAVMIHHSKLGEEDKAAEEVTTILTALRDLGVNALIGSPNTDAGGRHILQVYEQFRDTPGLVFYRNAPRSIFINLLRHAQFLIGNSSLGVMEAPTIPIPVINVGTRQRGRLAASNVIFVEPEAEAVESAIKQAQSPQFIASLQGIVNPYGDGYSVERAVNLILKLDYAKWLSKTQDPLEN